MYWIATYFSIAPGGVPAYLAWAGKYAAWLKTQPGFSARTVWNSYSHPAQYAGALRWESREQARAAMAGEGYAGFLAANPLVAGVTFHRPTEAYDSTLLVGDPSQSGKVLVATDWTIDLGKMAAFEQSRSEFLQLHLKLGLGFKSGRIYRLMGHPSTRRLIAFTYSNREDYLAVQDNPEIEAFRQAHPAAQYAATRPSGELYEMIATS